MQPDNSGQNLAEDPQTIRSELRRTKMEHVVSDIPFSRTEYNGDRMKRAKGHRKNLKHATIAFAVRSIEKRPKDIVTRQEAGH